MKPTIAEIERSEELRSKDSHLVALPLAPADSFANGRFLQVRIKRQRLSEEDALFVVERAADS